MNAPEPRALAALAPDEYSAANLSASALILGPAFERVQSFAAIMAKGAVTVPQHLRGNPGDCMAVALQALAWGMNPFAVAQKTHITQSGALGYEAQLVNAVITSSGAVDGQPTYEFLGDWDRILGRVEEKKNQNDKKYYAAGWTKHDEQGLGVVVGMTLRGEREPRRLRVMLSQCYPRFSTQWATDPMQQICYVAVRKWGRLYAPGAILGVYTPDELEAGVPEEKFMGAADVVTSAPAAAPAAAAGYPDAKFEENFPKWSGWIAAGRKSSGELIAFVDSAGVPLTEVQKARLNSVKRAEQPADAPPAAADPFTAPSFAEVANAIVRATTRDALAAAADLIKHVPDAAHQQELRGKCTAREEELA